MQEDNGFSPKAKAVLGVLAAVAWFSVGFYQIREQGGGPILEVFQYASEQMKLAMLGWLSISIPLTSLALLWVVKLFKTPSPPNPKTDSVRKGMH
jgi:hypothetical protein